MSMSSSAMRMARSFSSSNAIAFPCRELKVRLIDRKCGSSVAKGAVFGGLGGGYCGIGGIGGISDSEGVGFGDRREESDFTFRRKWLIVDVWWLCVTWWGKECGKVRCFSCQANEFLF